MTEYNDSKFQELLQEEVKGLSSYLVDEDYTNAIRDAEIETGFSLPLEDDIYDFLWLKKRAKRHLFFFLYSESAHKFKVDQINLQHRFEHYDKMIAVMDKEWKEELEANPHKYANVNPCHLFGSKVDAGFAYENETGRDITYDEDNDVNVYPSDTD